MLIFLILVSSYFKYIRGCLQYKSLQDGGVDGPTGDVYRKSNNNSCAYWICLEEKMLLVDIASCHLVMLSYNLIHFKVMATKVYTSNEFKRERDNFSSLCKVA